MLTKTGLFVGFVKSGLANTLEIPNNVDALSIDTVVGIGALNNFCYC